MLRINPGKGEEQRVNYRANHALVLTVAAVVLVVEGESLILAKHLADHGVVVNRNEAAVLVGGGAVNYLHVGVLEDALPAVDHVLSGELNAVGPLDAVTQLPFDLQVLVGAIEADELGCAVVQAGDEGGEVRVEDILIVNANQAVFNRREGDEGNVGIGVGAEQGVRLLAQAQGDGAVAVAEARGDISMSDELLLVLLHAEQTEQNLVLGLSLLRVELEALALEILHVIALAIGADLGELLTQRVAKLGQATIALPVGQERPGVVAQAVLGLREVEVGGGVALVGRHIKGATFRLVGTKQAEQHFVGVLVLSVALVAGALEPLGRVALTVGQANFLALISDRQAVDWQATVSVPVTKKVGGDGVAVHVAACLRRAARCGHRHHAEHEGHERERENAGILLKGF